MFHVEMIKACMPLIFRDDYSEHMDALLQEYLVTEFKSEVMIVTPRRWGKCLGADVHVRGADGSSTQRAADVRVGDLLMGDDGRPRVVMDTSADVGPLYAVCDARSGETVFECNDAHMLVLHDPCTGTTHTMRTDDYVGAACGGASTLWNALRVVTVADGSRAMEMYPCSVRYLGMRQHYGFQCAAFADDALAPAVATAMRGAGAEHGEPMGALLCVLGLLLPSRPGGAPTCDGRYPGRFVLADGTVTHNTYCVAMYVAAVAIALDGGSRCVLRAAQHAEFANMHTQW